MNADDSDFHRSIAACAAFIHKGMGDNGNADFYHALAAWGKGALELVLEASNYAVLAASVLREADRHNRVAAESHEIYFPDVYQYEVCSGFGRWFSEQVVETRCTPSCDEAEGVFLGMVREFFEQDLSAAEKTELAPRLEFLLERAMRAYSGGERGYQPDMSSTAAKLKAKG